MPRASGPNDDRGDPGLAQPDDERGQGLGGIRAIDVEDEMLGLDEERAP